MAESTGKRRASVGVLFWVAFILLVLVIFLANRGNIEQVLDRTGVVEVIRDRMAREDTPADDSSTTDGEVPADEPSPVATDNPEIVLVDDLPSTAAEDAVTAPAADEPRDGQDTVPEESLPSVEETRPETEQDASRPNRRMAALYFIRVTDDGRTYAQRVVRPVDYAESPLTETIRTLIAGPTGEELDEGLLNLIPAETELLSAHVDSGVAYLNFNQSFRFNPMGAEGTVAQLQQIIYSSTEFPTVTRVQFLVDGEKLDYVGGDGIYIGEPLGRDAFSS